MASNDELDARVTALEHQVRAIREDTAAARILAGGADRDVSAMESTLRGHTAKLDRHTATLDSHTAKLDIHKVLLESLRETQVEQGVELAGIRRVLASVAVGQAEIVALLSRPDDPEAAG